MRNITYDFYTYFGICLEGFFYGLYSAIFAMYLQHHTSRKDKTNNILFYALSALYVLSVGIIAVDIASYVVDCSNTNALPKQMIQRQVFLSYIPDVISSCCNFITQSILIYRCWIVWGQNIRVVIIPSILAFIFLAISLTFWGITLSFFSKHQQPAGTDVMAWIPLGIPLIVNTVVTGLIVFRILKVFREVKATSDELSLSTTDGRKLRSVIFVIIESGMALFSFQLTQVVLTPVGTDAAGYLSLIGGISKMLNGITPTVILVRVSMGLSFHDEKSIEEATASLRFAPDVPNPSAETGSIGM